jgi:hypothetical protein
MSAIETTAIAPSDTLPMDLTISEILMKINSWIYEKDL